MEIINKRLTIQKRTSNYKNYSNWPMYIDINNIAAIPFRAENLQDAVQKEINNIVYAANRDGVDLYGEIDFVTGIIREGGREIKLLELGK